MRNRNSEAMHRLLVINCEKAKRSDWVMRDLFDDRFLLMRTR